jgi:hypothetical protein
MKSTPTMEEMRAFLMTDNVLELFIEINENLYVNIQISSEQLRFYIIVEKYINDIDMNCM